MGEFNVLKRILGVIKHVHENPLALPPVSLSAASVLTSALPVFQLLPLAHSMLLSLIITFGVLAKVQFQRTTPPSQLTQKGFNSEQLKVYSIIGRLKDIESRTLRIQEHSQIPTEERSHQGLCFIGRLPPHPTPLQNFCYHVRARWMPLILSPP